mgnify:CR=1 FL=1
MRIIWIFDDMNMWIGGKIRKLFFQMTYNEEDLLYPCLQQLTNLSLNQYLTAYLQKPLGHSIRERG